MRSSHDLLGVLRAECVVFSGDEVGVGGSDALDDQDEQLASDDQSDAETLSESDEEHDDVDYTYLNMLDSASLSETSSEGQNEVLPPQSEPEFLWAGVFPQTYDEWSKCEEDLKPYEKYPVLYKERKKSRTFVRFTPCQSLLVLTMQQIRQTLSFTDDLPAEVRLMVYKNLPAASDNKLLVHIPNSFWRMVHERTNFQLMRLCRKAHTELGQVLYGRTLDFQGPAAFCALGMFVSKVQPRSFQFIRHIVMDVPSFEPLTVEQSVRALGSEKLPIPLFLDVRHKRQELGTTILAFQQLCQCLQQLKGLKRLDIRLSDNHWGINTRRFGWRCNMQQFAISRKFTADEFHHGGKAMTFVCTCRENSMIKYFDFKDRADHVQKHLNPGFWESLQQLAKVLEGLTIRLLIDSHGAEMRQKLSSIRESGRSFDDNLSFDEFCFTVWMLRKGKSLGWELGYEGDTISQDTFDAQPFDLPFLRPEEEVWMGEGRFVLRTPRREEQSPFSPFINISKIWNFMAASWSPLTEADAVDPDYEFDAWKLSEDFDLRGLEIEPQMPSDSGPDDERSISEPTQ